jgi:hypothetical protein
MFGLLEFCSATAAAQAADVFAVLHGAIFLATNTCLIRATAVGLGASLARAALTTTLPNTFALATFPTFIAVVA